MRILKNSTSNILKQKVSSIINTTGLSISLCSFIFILVYIADELSYDRYHKNAKNIYRVCRSDQSENAAKSSFPLAGAIRHDYPDIIKSSVRLYNLEVPKLAVRYGEKKYNETNFFYADSTIFDIFDFPFLEGNPQSALNHPYTIVITKSMAARYFGSENPIGKKLILDKYGTYEITGLLDNVPAQSHFTFEFLASFATVKHIFGGQIPDTWLWNPCWTYILLRENIEADVLSSKLPDFYERHYDDAKDEKISLWLQPLMDIHLKSNIDYEISRNGKMQHIYILATMALFLIFIACINFINLTTANSVHRLKEIGIQKILGTPKKELIALFLTESLLISLLSLFLALLLFMLFLPFFNDFVQKEISIFYIFQPKIIATLVFCGLLTVLFSGFHAALLITRVKPIYALRTLITEKTNSIFVRKFLVVLQFTISVALISGTFIVFSQIQKIYNADLGFDKNQIVIFHSCPEILKKYDIFISELKQHPEIVNVTGMCHIVGEEHNTWPYKIEGVELEKSYYHSTLLVRHDFFETFKLKLLTGRSFSRKHSTDTKNAVMISESMVKHLGWTNESAIGKKFINDGEERVIGVFEDFMALPLHKKSDEFVLDMFNDPAGRDFFTRYMAVKISTKNTSHTLAYMQKKWQEFAPDTPFEYFFLDKRLNTLYISEKKLGVLGLILSGLSIFIACLGLFGLTTFIVEKRKKEIAIRRIQGASTFSIIQLLSKSFLTLILIANLCAWIITYLFLSRWLQSFAVQTEIHMLYFVSAGLISFVFTFLIIACKSAGIIKVNPAHVLNAE